MSKATPQADTVSGGDMPVKSPLRARLRSWKWWVYGYVDWQPPEKPPRGYYFQLVMAVVLWTVIAVHPWLTTWINRHPPEFSSLEMVKGTVVRTSRKSPHLGLRLESGEILNMEYPGFLNTYGSSPGGTRGLGPNNEKIRGCIATVWFDRPKYTLWKRYRVWQVICHGNQFGATHRELVTESTMSLGLRGAFAFFVLPFFLVIYLIRYRGGSYESK